RGGRAQESSVTRWCGVGYGDGASGQKRTGGRIKRAAAARRARPRSSTSSRSQLGTATTGRGAARRAARRGGTARQRPFARGGMPRGCGMSLEKLGEVDARKLLWRKGLAPSGGARQPRG